MQIREARESEEVLRDKCTELENEVKWLKSELNAIEIIKKEEEFSNIYIKGKQLRESVRNQINKKSVDSY